MLDLLKRIGWLFGFGRPQKPAATPPGQERPGPIPLWIVLRLGDHLLIALTRQRDRCTEQWVWVWPFPQLKQLERHLAIQAARPGFFVDPWDAEKAWEYAWEAAQEWREAAGAEEDE